LTRYQQAIAHAEAQYFAMGYDAFPKYVQLLWLIDKGFKRYQARKMVGLTTNLVAKDLRAKMGRSDAAQVAYALLNEHMRAECAAKKPEPKKVKARPAIVSDFIRENYGDVNLARYQAGVNLQAAEALGDEREAQKWREILEEVV